MFIDDYVLFIKTSQISLNGAYKYFGVKKKTYAASIVQRIYDYYCKNAINLYCTYRKYYNKEFSSYEEYLEKKFNLFPNELKRLNSKHLYFKNTKLQPNCNITNLLDDVFILKTLKSFLGDEGSVENED